MQFLKTLTPTETLERATLIIKEYVDKDAIITSRSEPFPSNHLLAQRNKYCEYNFHTVGKGQVIVDLYLKENVKDWEHFDIDKVNLSE